MNNGFLGTNLDLLHLARGLALLVVAGCCVRLSGNREGRIPWRWFGIFGVSAGLDTWIEVLTFSMGDSPLFGGARTLVLALSLVSLFFLGRGATRGSVGRGLGTRIGAILLAGAAAACLGGWVGVQAGVRYSLGVAGGLWAAWALWTEARGVGGRRDVSLAVAAIALGGYAVFSCVAAPRVPFLNAASSGGASVPSGPAIPAAAFCTLLAWTLALSLCRRVERSATPNGTPTPWRRSPILLMGLPLVLLIAIGSCAINWLGHREDARQRALLLDMTQSFALTMPSTDLSILTAAEEDLGTPSYIQMKDHLRVLRENMPGARFLYLMRRTGGVIRFLADSEPAGSEAESPPGQVYNESTAGLERVFATSTPLVEGPITDAWGVWVSALVPLSAIPGGPVEAVLGLDQDANAFRQAVSAERLRGILALLLLITMTLAGWAFRERFAAELHSCELEGKADLVLRWGTPAVVLGTGVGLFFLAFMDARRQAQESFDSSFRHHAVEHMEMLSRGVSRQLIELNGMARFLNGASPMDGVTFGRYAREMLSESQAIEALAWVPRVSRSDRSSLDARAGLAGQRAFSISQTNSEGRLQPAGRLAEHFPVLYLSAMASPRLSPGIDLATIPAWRTALERARDGGRPAATEPIRLGTEDWSAVEFAVFVPVYSAGSAARTPAERRTSLLGFTVGLYGVDALVEEALRTRPAPGLVSFLEDLDAPPGHREILRSVPVGEMRGNRVPGGQVAAYQRVIEVAGRSWRLRVEPGVGFIEANFNRWYRLILPFGTVLSGLAAFLAFQTLNGRLRAERRSRQNQRLTGEQLRLNERFSLAAESAGIGVWDLDLQRGTLVWDERMHSLFRMTPTEAVSAVDDWEERIHPDDRAGVREEMQRAISGAREPDIEFRAVGSGGEVRHLKSFARVIRNDAGVPVRITGVSYDITERKQIELSRIGTLRRQDLLNQLQQTLLAPGDLAQKLKVITDGVVEILSADFCRVWHIARGDLCDRGCVHAEGTEGSAVCRDREKCLHLTASSGRYTHIDGPAHRRVPLGAYKIGRVASGAEHKFLTNDVTNEPRVHDRAWARELGLVSFAGYQLRPTGGETLGVLALFSRQALTPEEDAQLDALSHTAAQVIHADQIDLLLRRERILLRTVIDHIPYAIHAKDTQGQKTLANLADDRMFGLAPPDLADGTASQDEIQREATVLDREDDQSVLLSGQPILHREESVVSSEGRTIWVDTSKVPLRDEAGEIVGLVGIGQDITDRKKAEREHTQMEVQLRHAQKLESIGQLAAGIAHEINTPTQFIGDNNRFLHDAFTSLRNVLERLRAVLDAARRGEVPPALVAEGTAAVEAADLDYLMEEIPSALAQSLEGVSRVAKIVGAMKEFSHPGGEDFTAANINDAIESTVSVCRNEWKYVADLVMDLDPELPAFPCLVGDFNQVVLNLVINAAHAIAEVTPVAGWEKGTITVSTHRDGAWAEVRVSDTGAGIPESVREHIFTPFFTTKTVGKGTGQGLAIARSVVVDKHGGEISFESEVGRGTTFIVRLPMDRMGSPGGDEAFGQAA